MHSGSARSITGEYSTMPDRHLPFNTGGKIIDVNPVYFPLCSGMTSAEELIGVVNRAGSPEHSMPIPRNGQDLSGKPANHGTGRFSRTCTGGKMALRSWASSPSRSSTNPSTGTREQEGFILDITESRNAEARISAIERRYHNVFDASGDAMLVLDQDSGTILNGNPAAIRMYGYTRDELNSCGTGTCLQRKIRRRAERFPVTLPAPGLLPEKRRHGLSCRDNGQPVPPEEADDLHREHPRHHGAEKSRGGDDRGPAGGTRSCPRSTRRSSG